MIKRVTVIVLDSVGIGALPDWRRFDEEAGNTLAHIAETVKDFHLPHLQAWGLGNILSVTGCRAVEKPLASFGRVATRSAGKDTMIGHWEMMGIVTPQPLPLYPQGFPAALVDRLVDAFGRSILGNKPASGTEIIAEYGAEHLRTGFPIVYTSGDSVLQIACHEDIIGHDALYRLCEKARAICRGEHAVGRVIARPFEGTVGRFTRNAYRRDYPLEPPADNYLAALRASKIPLYAIGKIGDIFGDRCFDRVYAAKGNDLCTKQLLTLLATVETGFIFVNLVDFDMLYGHRNDAVGYAHALMAFDNDLATIQAQLRDDDLLIITADHGNDPTLSSTDHTREYVPLLSFSSRRSGLPLGSRDSLADIGATVYETLTGQQRGPGRSFY